MSWDATPTLVGRHVTLRPLVADDKDALVAAASADDLWDLFYANVAMMKAPDRWFAAALREQDFGRARIFAVVAGDAVVGSTRFMRMNAGNKRLEIGGTFYATAVQRTGVNTEAKLMLLTHAFETLGCECVQIRTDSLNKRSQAAIERLGAKRDGVLRGHQVMADGRLRDTVVYSILAHEWPGVRQNLTYLLSRHGCAA
ncbi:GNAT family N-acetyltransferase [Sphingomonas sp. Leaf38]|jgi:RimJ/RimL family protein N-acetyltransferase|uniref:GNAT family N-acetyltransferase n=1 Tax=Sphingomonas sp. Leaf38 TaxID=1736217 RepID=UPI0006F288BC|nr:GNAT family protein [Sphingomonas sp. Leaf38]KQN27585.1 acetyltransferase [Sphingomonas sp. Leaf38]